MPLRSPNRRAAALGRAAASALMEADVKGLHHPNYGNCTSGRLKAALRPLAEDSNLSPWCAWPEWASGANGMGTALESHGPVVVAGPEHWCIPVARRHMPYVRRAPGLHARG